MLGLIVITAAVAGGVALAGAVYLMLWSEDLANHPFVETAFRHAQPDAEHAVSCANRTPSGGPRRGSA